MMVWSWGGRSRIRMVSFATTSAPIPDATFSTDPQPWSVPSAFLQGFAQGTVWSAAATPDPNNGHFTPLADVDTNGFYRIWTWGSWAWVSPAFIASVDPECFVTFSALQFNKATGLDSHGRHVSDQAAKWVALGGNAQAVAAVVATFPLKQSAPVTGPVTLAQAQTWVAAGINAASGAIMTKEEAIAAANAGLNAWPKA